MYEDLADVLEDLRAAIQAGTGLHVGYSPADSTGSGATWAFLDSPTLNPATARLSGVGGVAVPVLLVAAGSDREQVKDLYRHVGPVLEAIPSTWTLTAEVQPYMVAERPAFRIPLAR